MSERNASQVYGVRVGLVAGLFALTQVVVSTLAARGAMGGLLAMQRALNILSTGGLADPTLLIGPLVPMLLVTYAAMALAGALTIYLAGRAGEMAAIARGRRIGGGAAGMWVWLVATLIWLVGSVVAVVITHSDGTISGVFTGTFTPDLLPQQTIFLLLQLVIAALIALGFCALWGARGARNAPLVEPEPQPYFGAPMGPMGFPPPPGMYPAYPAYPAPFAPPYGAYPPPGWGMAPMYPPAPNTAPTMPQRPNMGPIGPMGPIPYPPPPSFYTPEAPTHGPAHGPAGVASEAAPPAPPHHPAPPPAPQP